MPAHEQVLRAADQAYVIAEKTNDRAAMGAAVFKKAQALLALGRNQEAIRQFTQDLVFFTEPESDHAAEIYNGMVEGFYRLGILDEALECLGKVHAINQKTGNRQAALLALLNTGLMNIELEHWHKALAHLLLVEEAVSAGEPLPQACNLPESIGICLIHLGRHEEAEAYFESTSGCPDVERDTPHQISAALNRSLYLEKTGRGSAAMAQASQAIEKALALGNMALATKALLRLIEIRLAFGPIADSRSLLDAALALNDTSYPPQDRIHALLLRSAVAEMAGDFDAALRDQKEARRRETRLSQDSAAIKLDVLGSRLALEKERREHEASRNRNQDLEVLNSHLDWVNRLGSIVNASLDWSRIARDLVAELRTRIPLDAFGIVRVHSQDQEFEQFIYIENGEAMSGKGKYDSEFRRLALSAASQRSCQYRREDKQCMAAMPLILFDEVIGIMLAGCSGSECLAESHLALLEAITPVLAASFKNAESFQDLTRAKNEILHIANHDPLTGLYNRRFLFDVFDSFRSAVVRSGKNVCVFYLDLDRFKPINDQLGHQAGDQVLQTVAARFLEEFRESDVCARIGGDEFVVLASVSSLEEASLVRQKMHDALAAPIKLCGKANTITASIGLAVDLDGTRDLDGLLHQADIEMLGSKHRK